MISKIFTIAALIGMGIAAATPSTHSLNLAALQALQATEAPRLAASGIVLHHTEALPDGYFVEIYGSVENNTSPAVQQHQHIARAPLSVAGKLGCGMEKIECDWSPTYGVKEEVTERLIRHLFDRKDWTSRQPRSFCLYGKHSRACVSWNRDVGSFPWAFLAPATQRIWGRCGEGHSGRDHNVVLRLLGGWLYRCIGQCLSNRPDGC
ncbi:hypothetical protein QBC41DRAFT_106344 [Cercophora samala]|uniref:WD-like domain-containing protein n=1 Tax=Cercophora samala TaxID=330535 RepID=A0AA40DAL5_9PEZI|nr:hypothetical protein QBC41DRAFT_106344 [Cercophora samala]